MYVYTYLNYVFIFCRYYETLIVVVVWRSTTFHLIVFSYRVENWPTECPLVLVLKYKIKAHPGSQISRIKVILCSKCLARNKLLDAT